jgi:glycosyltransferase involved in cell wall biosynthesis
VEVVKDFKKAHPKIPIEFHTFNPADRDNITALNNIGVKPKLHVSRDISLPYADGDVLVLNTVAFSDTMRDGIYDNLEKGVIKKLLWYVHEDEPGYIFNKAETSRIKRLMGKDRITIFAAAQKTRDNYRQHFDVAEQIKTQIYRVNVPDKYHKTRTEKDFERLDFILPGMVGDGRKGQLPIIYAFIEFKQRYFDKDPDKYRDFSLTYIGMGSDFLSRQILKHTDKGLGKRFRHYGKISHEACLDYVLDANFTVCYSMRECLPMFVYEGMIAGHPLLRNDSSGLEEQLVADKNGYYLDSKDFEQVVQTIEKACNKTKTTNDHLASMSKLSYGMASKLEHQSYDLITESIATSYAKGGQ